MALISPPVWIVLARLPRDRPGSAGSTVPRIDIAAEQLLEGKRVQAQAGRRIVEQVVQGDRAENTPNITSVLRVRYFGTVGGYYNIHIIFPNSMSGSRLTLLTPLSVPCPPRSGKTKSPNISVICRSPSALHAPKLLKRPVLAKCSPEKSICRG
jgi:hypothetical protein